MKKVTDSRKCSHLSPRAWGYKGTPMCAMQQLFSRATLSSTNVGSSSFVLAQSWEGFARVVVSTTASVHFLIDEGNTEATELQGRQTPASLSVCDSLAPSCCRLSKHTNITAAVKVPYSGRLCLHWRVLETCPYKAASEHRHGHEHVLITLSAQNPLRFEKAPLSVWGFHHGPGKSLSTNSRTVSQGAGMVLRAIQNTAVISKVSLDQSMHTTQNRSEWKKTGGSGCITLIDWYSKLKNPNKILHLVPHGNIWSNLLSQSYKRTNSLSHNVCCHLPRLTSAHYPTVISAGVPSLPHVV